MNYDMQTLVAENGRLRGVNEELRRRSSLLAVIQGAGFWRRLWWVIAGVPHE